MVGMNRTRLRNRLIEHEGLRLKPYPDQFGLTTIGIGRCLDRKGISEVEANLMLDNDIDDCVDDCKTSIPFFDNLDNLRQEVLLEMCFQMGIGGLLGFKRTLHEVEIGNYKQASVFMLESKLAKQTPARAKKLAGIMATEDGD